MNKTQAIAAVLDAAPDAPTVFTTGYASRIAAGLADRPTHFAMTGSMGLALPLGAGVAQSSGRATIVVDGDGSLLMNPAGLQVAAQHPRLPLVHVVLDDGRYASTGGQPTAAARLGLCALAVGSGYPDVRRTKDADELRDHLRAVLTDLGAPVFIHCLLDDPDDPVPPRVERPLPQITARFTAALAALGGDRAQH